MLKSEIKQYGKKTQIQWEDVHIDYLSGMNTSTLQKKYNISSSYLDKKITQGGWQKEREELATHIYDEAKQKIVTDTLDSIAKRNKRIDCLTGLALDKLEEILNNSDNIKTSDLINAIGKVIDISGLKYIQNGNGDCGAKKIFITKIDEVNANKHIEQIIGDATNGQKR